MSSRTRTATTSDRRQLDPPQRTGCVPPEPRDLPARRRPPRREQRDPRPRQGVRHPGVRQGQSRDRYREHDGRRATVASWWADRWRGQRPRAEQHLRLQRPLWDLARSQLPLLLDRRSQCRLRERLRPNEAGCSGLNYAGGNRTADPLFRSYGSRDLHLLAGGPALDYAVPEYSAAMDFDGVMRTYGSGPTPVPTNIPDRS